MQMDSAIGDHREWANGIGDLILDWARDGQESTATQVMEVLHVFECSCLFCSGIPVIVGTLSTLYREYVIILILIVVGTWYTYCFIIHPVTPSAR